MTDKKKQFISIIIPVYNGGNTIGYCLNSIFQSSYKNFECIVVDDHSSDNTLEIVQSYRTKIIRIDKQKGASHARNRGAAVAQGHILLFIDADVIIYPDTLEKIIKTFDRNPHISALFGSYDDQPWNPNFLSQYRNLFHHYIHQTSNVNASTFWTGLGSIKKDIFFKVGKFDENCRMMEDIELGYKLKAQKYEILLVKNIFVKHFKHYSLYKLLKSDLFDRAIPWTVLMFKNKEYTSDLNLKISHKLSAVTIMLLLLIPFITIASFWFVFTIPILFFLYLFLNLDVYRFFYQKRGLVFALKVIPFHILYYVYSTLGFIMGVTKYFFDKRFAS